MNLRSRWLSLAISLGVILSMALVGFATNVKAAPAKKASQHQANKHAQATCKKHTKASGTIKYSDVQFPDNLNPDQTGLVVSYETINSLQDGLMGFNPKVHLFADMLTRIPSVKNGDIKNGGKTYTFHFKHGMTWSNGQPITSADQKFGLAIDNDPASGPACDAGCNVVARYDTPDKYTAVAHLKHVDAAFLTAAHYGEIWPTKWPGAWSNNAHDAALKIWQDSSFNFEGPNFPTSGPYQVAEFVANDRIVLHPRKNYNILNCGGAVQNLIFSFYADTAGEIGAAATRATDVTQDYTLASLAELKSHKTYKTSVQPSFTIEHLELNQDAQYNGKANPLANPKVRDALALAVNKVSVLQSALSVTAKVAKGVEAYSFLVNTPTLKQPFTDKDIKGQWDPISKKYLESGSALAVKDAKKLLSQAGFGSGFTVDFQTTTRPATRLNEEAAIAQQWRAIGVTVNQMQTPAGKLFANWDEGGTLDHGAYQVALFAFSGSSPDPDGFKADLETRFVDRRQATHATTNGNYAGVHDKAIDAAFKAGSATLSNKVRQKEYNIVQLHVNQNADWIPLYYRPQLQTTDGRVLNYSTNPNTYGPEWNTFAWKVKGS
jgi:peptide/nickel transport system substrate-binding protein